MVIHTCLDALINYIQYIQTYTCTYYTVPESGKESDSSDGKSDPAHVEVEVEIQPVEGEVIAEEVVQEVGVDYLTVNAAEQEQEEEEVGVV